MIIHTPDLVLQNVQFHTPSGAVYSKVKDDRINVLFVCLGNAARSQMAEAFAKAYGPDVMRASSASLSSLTRLISLSNDLLRLSRPESNFSCASMWP